MPAKSILPCKVRFTPDIRTWYLGGEGMGALFIPLYRSDVSTVSQWQRHIPSVSYFFILTPSSLPSKEAVEGIWSPFLGEGWRRRHCLLSVLGSTCWSQGTWTARPFPQRNTEESPPGQPCLEAALCQRLIWLAWELVYTELDPVWKIFPFWCNPLNNPQRQRLLGPLYRWENRLWEGKGLA